MSPTSKNPMPSLVASKAAGACKIYLCNALGRLPQRHYALPLGLCFVCAPVVLGTAARRYRHRQQHD
jgi:hypothetical protein